VRFLDAMVRRAYCYGVTGPYPGARVPVTAKLSRRFYEKFGDDIANELVDWFNMVDATYRSDLRELNELNFARFDAKLEQRIAELRAEFNTRIAELRADMQVGFKNVDIKLEQLETRLTKRLFGFWIAQAATTVGLVFGVVKLLQ
ncbi:MAG TPA: hypothetical protein VGU74_01570, partial [Gemmatimonadales bacterium]|nr:hypothetical protein [Gemmatimonadales bacterium]